MKTLAALLAVSVVSCSELFSQSEWMWQHPRPQGHTLREVTVRADGFGWAVGDYGTILATTDGGATWQGQFSGTSEHLIGVQTFDAATVYATSAGGTVTATTDGGVNWSLQTGSAGAINRSFWINPSTGWVVGNGGVIKKSTNGGADWTDQTSGTSLNLRGCVFVNCGYGNRRRG